MLKRVSSEYGFAPRLLLTATLCAASTLMAMFTFAASPWKRGSVQPEAHAQAAANTGPGFHSPVSLPGSTSGTEPSLAIPQQLRAGLRFATWQNPGEIATSLDGVNFVNRGTRTGGGDVTNAADPAGTLFFGQFCSGAFTLHACLERSMDGGATWPLHTDIADMHPGAADRPWIETYPHKTSTLASAQAWNSDATRVYLEYHTFSPEELAYVTVSADGGHTFSEAKLISSDTNALVASGCNTIPGGVVVDQYNGTVYALWLSGNDVVASTATGCNYSQIGPFNKAWVSRSSDGGNTWTATLAWQGAFDPVTKVGDNADKIFATLTVDQAGQVHVILPVRHNDDPLGFTADCQVNANCVEAPNDTDLLIVSSPDAGAHWTAPTNIENSSGSYFFPWAAAGSQGTVNVVYYKSSTRQPNRQDNIWYVGHTRVTGAVATYSSGPNATYTNPPQFIETLLDSGPIHGNGTSGGGICTFGLFCAAVPGANRTLADSLAVTLDPAGGVNAVWTDAVGNPGNAKEIHFTCQNSGPSSFGGGPDLNGCYGPADLSVTKTDSPSPVAPGTPLTYHLTVTNHGTPAMPATTSGVTLTDILPPGVSFVSATPSVGSCSGTSTVVCDLGIFPSGASATVDIVVNVAANATGTLTNTASVVSLTDDPDMTNNTATVVTTLDPLAPTAAYSEKIHGSAGALRIALPLTGTPGVECRKGQGANENDHKVVITFPLPVTVNGANAHKADVAGTATISNVTVNGSTVTLALTGVANAQMITITLLNVSDGSHTGNVTIPMSLLLGDIDGNGNVSGSDVNLCKAKVGANASQSNCRADVDVTGSVSGSDVNVTKMRVGSALH